MNTHPTPLSTDVDRMSELLTLYRRRFQTDGHGMKSVDGVWTERVEYDAHEQYVTAVEIMKIEADLKPKFTAAE